ncbi:hypothetical protein [Ktedonospora formicarum]|uniref:Uncharacterized protein n=1 Tax=Ktedonospora formicarum TaxID=2778364 RepID=A0A8J3HYH2_9CHLR|nr:hypothetical protein [Ktedonospora formicarum]GHO46064.1 hypothetical protein KSX_42270 [Ktedonospora formicarum]
MNESQQQPDNLTEAERGGSRAERLGHQLGFAIGRMRQQIQHVISDQHPGEAHENRDAGEQHTNRPDEAGSIASSPRTHRAEEIVDEAGHRLSVAASRTGAQLQKATARAREEAEDILAEARYLRHRPANKPESGNQAPSHTHERPDR